MAKEALNSVFQIPDGYAAVEIEGELVIENNHLLIINDEDKSQYWLANQTSPTNVEPEENLNSSANNEKTNQERRKDWSEADTKLFLTLLEQHKHELNDPKHKKKAIFEIISKDMSNRSVGKPTAFQCENRYKSLLKKFREITDHNNTTGNSRKDWKYFEAMSDFVGERPNIQPVAGCSSWTISHNVKENSLKTTLAEKLTTPKKKRNLSNTETITIKNKKSKVRSELLTFVKEMEDKANKREEQKMKMIQQQHNEIKEFMDKILKSVTTMANKTNEDKVLAVVDTKDNENSEKQ